MMTMSTNRMLYADGSLNPRLGSVGAAEGASDMGISWGDDGHRGSDRLVLPRVVGVGHLEADVAVEDVEQRAQDVEEAERQVRRGGHAEDAGHVGAAGVPRHQDRRDRAGVL